MPCQTVTIESVPNTSDASVSLDNVSTPALQTVEVTFTLSNEITSGDGETLSPTVAVTVRGSRADSETITVPPGSSETRVVAVENVSGGSANICVELV